jgi:diguanylate cyclase (GGDEF)-like protein
MGTRRLSAWWLAANTVFALALARALLRRDAEIRRGEALLSAVARAGRNISVLGTDEVLAGVTAAVAAMGMESANISVIDEERGTYRVIHAIGMPDDYVAAEHPATIGMTGLAREARGTVAIADYARQAAAVPVLAAAGFTSAVSSPIWVDGALAGVLVGGSKRHRRLGRREIDAFELLATHASVALQNAQRYEQLEHSAHHDALTGLPNRQLLRERLESALTRGRVALLYLDLDRFKAVNDRLGHAAGDQLLVAVAERLKGSLREYDTAARIGGDEFVVVCDVADAGEAEQLAERLRLALDHRYQHGDASLPVSASVGVAFTSDPHVTPEQALAEADAAMYAAKARTRR